jgi:membrane protease subunit HflK
MAEGEENVATEERVRRSVARALGNGLVVLGVLAALAGWGWFGFYQLEPGQSAIILRLGRHVNTVTEPGLHFHLPPPIERRDIVKVDEVARQDFGVPGGTEEETPAGARLESSMQTSDNNIVQLSFVVQYRIKDAFASRYRVADPTNTLRDAAQAAMREVVGQMTIDGVLSERRGDVEFDSKRILQEILDSYETGLQIQAVQLQDVQPPKEVRAAFDDVIAAAQDASRTINEAEGYRNELTPGARAEAAELLASAAGYREATIAESEGEAARFSAIAAEYHKAPEVTRKRLFLETMETILPDVEKIIIEPGTASVLPYLPLGRDRRPGVTP